MRKFLPCLDFFSMDNQRQTMYYFGQFFELLFISENITCYEKIEDFSSMRENARFWLEGIGITVVGVVGLAGNIMAVFVLSTYSTNVSFNRLLMSLAVVDSLLIVDMVIQKAIIGKNKTLFF